MQAQTTFHTRSAAEFYLKTLADTFHLESLREHAKQIGSAEYREMRDEYRARKLAIETSRILRGVK